MYFIIFKKKDKDPYRYFTNQIFNLESEASDFAKRSFGKRNKLWKVVSYDSNNINKYWY